MFELAGDLYTGRHDCYECLAPSGCNLLKIHLILTWQELVVEAQVCGIEAPVRTMCILKARLGGNGGNKMAPNVNNEIFTFGFRLN